jgi:peptidyl-dipeptidase A
LTLTRFWRFSIVLVLALGLTQMAACAGSPGSPTTRARTAADATKFLADVNATMLRLGTELSQAGWVQSTYITPDTEALNARADQTFTEAVARFAKEAAAFDNVTVSPDERRQLNLLKLSLEKITPSDQKEAEELSKLAAGLEGAYGRGKWCKEPEKPDTCLDIEKITELLATSRDPKRLREVWEGWHTISPPMRANYTRFVELANKGAKELGFADTGAMWRL